MLLTVTYPEAYPDVAPHLELSNLPNAPKHPSLDMGEDRHRLLADIQPTVDENIGMAMIFTIVSALKDAAETLISERKAAAQEVRDLESAKAEEEENRKFHGTAVTKESFLKWRQGFRQEMEEEEERKREERVADEKKKRAKPEEKLTGKQLWERGLAGKVEEEDEEEAEDSIKALSAVKLEE